MLAVWHMFVKQGDHMNECTIAMLPHHSCSAAWQRSHLILCGTWIMALLQFRAASVVSSWQNSIENGVALRGTTPSAKIERLMVSAKS